VVVAGAAVVVVVGFVAVADFVVVDGFVLVWPPVLVCPVVVLVLLFVLLLVFVVRCLSLVGVVVDEFEFCARVNAERAKIIVTLIINLFILVIPQQMVLSLECGDLSPLWACTATSR